jgi:hypothetical protein
MLSCSTKAEAELISGTRKSVDSIMLSDSTYADVVLSLALPNAEIAWSRLSCTLWDENSLVMTLTGPTVSFENHLMNSKIYNWSSGEEWKNWSTDICQGPGTWRTSSKLVPINCST